jgi:hypothetical protein
MTETETIVIRRIRTNERGPINPDPAVGPLVIVQRWTWREFPGHGTCETVEQCYYPLDMVADLVRSAGPDQRVIVRL